MSVTAWVAATILLGLVYEHASLLGDAFGPLIGVGALLVWAYATGLAVLFGLAFAAQLEAERRRTHTSTRRTISIGSTGPGAVAQLVRAADS